MEDENKGGHAKITVDIEINEPIMEIIKKSMDNIPAMMQMIEEQAKKQ